MPEYNDATWFTMLFSCGVSTGLFFFGVAEPILHYTGKNRQDNQEETKAKVVIKHWKLSALSENTRKESKRSRRRRGRI